MGKLKRNAAFLRPAKSHLEIVEDFRACDRNADGRIDYSEFKEFLEYLDAQIDPTEMRIGFGEIDSDRNGLIDLAEFLVWWRAQ